MADMWLLLGAGVFVLVGMTADLLSATMGVGGGWASRPLTKWLWAGAVWASRWVPWKRRLLTAAGIVLNVQIALMWVAALVVGWLLIFLAVPGSVLHAETRLPADGVSQFQYITMVLSSQGRGFWMPAEALSWKLVTVIMGISGTFIISFTISFLIPVIQASAERRTLGYQISLLGDDPCEILNTFCEDGSADALHDVLQRLLASLVEVYEQHRTYPTLYFLLSPSQRDDMSLNFVRLDETLSLLQHALPSLYEPMPRIFEPTRRVMTDILESLDDMYLLSAPDEAPPALTGHLTLSADHGAWRAAIDDPELRCRREKLGTLLHNAGWSWRDVYARL